MNPWTKLLIDLRAVLAANAVLAPIPMVIEHEGQPVAIVKRSRDGGTATLETSAPHGLKDQAHARIELMSDDTYDADDVVVTVIDATRFSYPNFGAEEIDLVEAAGLVTPLLVPITAALNFSLAKGGLLKGSTGKAGMAILLMTPRGGRSQANTRSVSPQTTTLRVAIFVRPLLNSAGLQLQPMEVLHAVEKEVMAWNRGPGQQPNQINLWDSRENPDGELSYFADFEIPQFIPLA